jgi:amino acid adenylation domain-containing protein
MIAKTSSLLPVDQQAILSQCFHPTGEWVEFPPDWLERSLPERFEYMVARYPDRIALRIRDEQLTYAELNRAANQVAHFLLARCGPDPEPVPLFFQHGVQILIAMWGILKAGKFYVPLNVDHPLERNAQILDELNASILLTHTQSLPTAQALRTEDMQLLTIEESDGWSDDNLSLSIAPEAFAYVIFTSGSTGKPKGVIEDHQNVMHFSIGFVNCIHICPEDRLGITASFSFNGAAGSIFPALLCGATLYALDLNQQGIAAVADWLSQEEITIFVLLPSVFRQWAPTLPQEKLFPNLRYLRLGADRMVPADWDLYQVHFFDHCVLRHGLAASEVKFGTHYYMTKEKRFEGKQVPVGYPVEGIEVLILDEEQKPLSFDQVGEIAFKGRYMAHGYWHQPQLTAAKFFRDSDGMRIYLTGDLGKMRADGLLYHLGRKDFQVKVHGYRIEITEIEAHLLELETIQEAVVIAQDDPHGEKKLVAYLVPKVSPPPTVTQIRRYLQQRLPNYMLPVAYCFLERLPQTDMGKIDRRALPEINRERPPLDTPYTAPRTPMEKALVQLWTELLDLDQVGIDDPFLDLGGDSLKAMQILAQVTDAFQVEIMPSTLFVAQTVAEMAQFIFRQQVQATDSAEIEQLLAELEHKPVQQND